MKLRPARPDEVALFDALRLERPHPTMECPNVEPIAARLGISPERAERILSRWEALDWWSFGVSTRTGWFTATAPASLQLGGPLS